MLSEPSQSSSNVRPSTRPRGASERLSAREDHTGRYSGRVVADTEETARKRDHHVKGKHASVGERAGMVKRHAAGALDELVTEAALSRARLCGNQDDVRST